MRYQYFINLRQTFLLLLCFLLPIFIVSGNIDVFGSHIVMLIVLALFDFFLLSSIYKGKESRVEGEIISFLALFYLLISFFTTFFISKTSYLANHYVHELLYGAMLYTIVISLFRKNKNTINIFFRVNLLLMLAFIGQYWYIEGYLNKAYEFYGLLKTKHFLCIYLIVSLMMSFDRKLLNKYGLFLFVLLTVFTVIDSGSRISVLSLFISGLIYWILSNPRVFKTFYILLIISLIAILTYALYQIRPASVNGRFLLWEIGLNGMEWKYILFGRGLGFIEYNIADLQGDFMARQVLSNRLMAGEVKTVLNEYVRFFVETGLVGLCLIGAIIYIMLKNLYLVRLNGAFSALCALLVCCFASYPLLSPIVQVLFIFLLAFSALPCKRNILIFNLFDPNSKFLNGRKVMIGLCVTIFLGMLFFRHVDYALNLLKWKNVSDVQHQANEHYFRNTYRNLYKSLRGEPGFLHDYGARLQTLDDYEAADTVLRHLVRIQPTYKRYLMLGYNYETMAKYDLAEFFYKKAENILPNAFMPKYMLFDLYRITENMPKATDMAKYILSHPVKVKNENVSHIKNEAIYYLHNINPKL